MGLRYHRTLKILPGVKILLNSQGGATVSIGTKAARISFNQKGARVNLRIPGTGLSYHQRIGKPPQN